MHFYTDDASFHRNNYKPNHMTITESSWIADQQLIITRISGPTTAEDVSRWEATLQKALNQIPDQGIFKILVDLHGFKAVNFEVHKQFRVIIPGTLAAYNWRVGYLDMFPEASIELNKTRGIECVAAVHVHDDETKIRNYDLHYSRPNERFFTDRLTARQWIEAFEIHHPPFLQSNMQSENTDSCIEIPMKSLLK